MRKSLRRIGILTLLLLAGPYVIGALAQGAIARTSGATGRLPRGAPLPAPTAVPAAFPPGELDRIVSPIALYPDPLLAQVLAAATFSDQIPEAAGWADQHHYLTGPQLTAAMAADQVPWDPSVQALIPFPSILGMMASDMPWSQELGNAFLIQQRPGDGCSPARATESRQLWLPAYQSTDRGKDGTVCRDRPRQPGLHCGALL